MNHLVSQRFIECFEHLRKGGTVRSARQFAMSLGFHPQSLNEILKHRRDVTIDLIAKAAEKFKFNPNYLYAGTGRHFSSDTDDQNVKILTVTVDNTGQENIVHIPYKAQAGYVVDGNPVELSERVTNYTIPGLEHRFGSFRSFEVKGESMEPTIHEGEIVVCRYMDPSFWGKQIIDDHVYVVVTESSVVIKRLSNNIKSNNTIQLNSDNVNQKEFAPMLLLVNDIKEIWCVERVISNFEQREMRRRQQTQNPISELDVLQSMLDEMRNNISDK